MVEVSKKLQNEIAAVQAAIVSPIANKEPDNSPLVEIAARIAAMEARALAEAEAHPLDNLPEALRSSPRWAVSAPEYKWQRIDGTIADYSHKAPLRGLDPTTKRCTPASSTRPEHWLTLGEAKALMAQEPAAVAGVMLGKDRGGDGGDWVGLDFDYYHKDMTPAVRAWLEEMIAVCPGYAEKSPSGDGARVFVQGTYKAGSRKDGVEIYTSGRFLRVTGNTITERNADAIIPAQDWLDAMAGHIGEASGGGIVVDKKPLILPNIAPDELTTLFLALRDKMRFSDLDVWTRALSDKVPADFSKEGAALVFGLVKAGATGEQAGAIMMHFRAHSAVWFDHYATECDFLRKLTAWVRDAVEKAPAALARAA